MNTLSNDTQQSINILAFDTSGDEASLALWVCGKLRTVSLPFGTGSHSQAACLIPMMTELLREENIDFQDLQVIATTKGPGSFTGIRIGLATAQGLVSATKAISFAPSTFEVSAFGAWKRKADSYLVTLTTKRDSFYVQGFDEALVPLESASIQTEEEIQEFLVTNPHMTRVENASVLSAENLIFLYLHRLKTNRPVLPLEFTRCLRPCYVHDPEFVKQKPWSL